MAPAGPISIWLTSRTVIDQPSATDWQTYLRVPPHPPPPPVAPAGAWAGVCGRLSGAKMNVGTAGVCLRVNATHWTLAENKTALGAGAIPTAGAAEAAAAQWRALRLAFDGQRVAAHVGSATVGTFTVQATAGMAGLQSSWHRAQFDHFEWARATVAAPPQLGACPAYGHTCTTSDDCVALGCHSCYNPQPPARGPPYCA